MYVPSQAKRTRELLQLVETKGLGEDVGVLPIHRNILEFDFNRKLTDKMVVHLNVLSPSVEDRIFCKLDATEVVVIDRRRISRRSSSDQTPPPADP